MRLRISAVLPFGIAAVLGCDDAFASGFMVRENSAEGVSMVSAGNGSRADEAATVFNNPAGMMHLAGPEVEIAAAVVFPSIRFSGGATIAGTTPVTGTQGGQAGQITGIPSLYAVLGVSDDVRVGLAITAPFGDGINYKSDWVGRYAGIKTLAQSVDFNPNIAWPVRSRNAAPIMRCAVPCSTSIPSRTTTSPASSVLKRQRSDDCCRHPSAASC
jgi:long-chain fatty acid transport protein